jgi:archaellum biogenesis ATPase FlaH
MRIITTLLVLLLASPSVLAETWVCSFLNPSDEIVTLSYERTSNGFVSRMNNVDDGVFDENWSIVHEDIRIIVLIKAPNLHSNSNDPEREELYLTRMIHLTKNNNRNFIITTLLTLAPDGNQTNEAYEGTCTVVE